MAAFRYARATDNPINTLLFCASSFVTLILSAMLPSNGGDRFGFVCKFALTVIR